MITFISFALIIVGALNWLSIGALQYDFVAGLFGTQASMFSRIVYFFIGIASVWIVIQLIRGKGKIKINDDGFDKSKKLKNDEKSYQKSNVEAEKDFIQRQNTNNHYETTHYKDTSQYDVYEDNGRRFPRDFSRYEEPTKKEENTFVDYKKLGYKDFNEEDLDK